MADPKRAAAMAEQIQAACVEAMLDWGARINHAEALPPGPAKDVAMDAARLAGGEVFRLATGLAKTLRPEVRHG